MVEIQNFVFSASFDLDICSSFRAAFNSPISPFFKRQNSQPSLKLQNESPLAYNGISKDPTNRRNRLHVSLPFLMTS